MSVNRLAIELRVPATRMLEIVNGRRGITADTARPLLQHHPPNSGCTCKAPTISRLRPRPSKKRLLGRCIRGRRL